MAGCRVQWARRLVVWVAVAVVSVAVAAAPGAAQDDAPYSDVAADAYYAETVSRLSADGVFEGTECDEGFCPDEAIDRATMAVWTVRVVDEADPAPVSSTRFADVDATHAQAAFVERLAALGVTQGCGDGTNFCPDSAVTRAEMAVFLSRAFDLAEGPDPGFGDVPADAWYAADVAKLAASGITTGCGDGTNFCPDQDTTRAQMASFLARALGLVELPASVRFTALDTGEAHSCALRTDSTVVCWGDNAHGQADAPDGAFQAVSAGGSEWDGSHSCALRTDGTVVCWGSNNVGQSDAPGGEFVTVSAGGYHSCGVRVDATVACWGLNTRGRSDAPGGEFVMVSAGGGHTCGVRVDATVACWGWRIGGATDAPGGEFVTVSAGSSSYSCGVRVDATVACWGSDLGLTEAPGGQFVEVSVGVRRVCGLRVDGRAVCWRLHPWQQAVPDGEFVTVSAGRRHSCGLRVEGTVVCWGDHSEYASPADAPVGKFAAVVAGDQHACGLRVDSSAVCWGRSLFGEAHASPGKFSAVSAGGSQSCGVRVDGEVACWGERAERQADATGGKFRAVTSGDRYSCGLRVNYTIECWGVIDDATVLPIRGQFDEIAAGGRFVCGLRRDRTIACWTPLPEAQVDPPDGRFDGVSVGGAHGCGLRSEGVVVCWGDDSHGQSDAPDGRFVEVSAGGLHSCGLRADRTVECWGDDSDGQSDAPDGRFVAVSAGSDFSCGVHESGAIRCWGSHVVGPPVGVQETGEPLGPDPHSCRPFADGGTANWRTTTGFPPSPEVSSTTGRLRVAVLFVDFDDAIAINSAQQESLKGLPYMRRYLEASSYRRLRIESVPLLRWLRAEHGYQHYLSQSAYGPVDIRRRIDREVVWLADPHFDFSGIDAAMIVMPSAHFSGGNARGYVESAEGLVSTLRVNTIPAAGHLDAGYVMAHELAHNLGLADLYPYKAHPYTSIRRPAPPADGKSWRWVELGLMGLASWVPTDRVAAGEIDADEMLAWSRWQLGWLGEDRIRCIREPAETVELSPVADPGNGVAMAAVPLSQDEVIVVESRRRIGYDKRAAWGEGAVVVYTVDAWVPSGELPIRLAGDAGRGYTRESPILAEGESVTVRGYTITVTADDGDTHTVHITRTD